MGYPVTIGLAAAGLVIAQRVQHGTEGAEELPGRLPWRAAPAVRSGV